MNFFGHATLAARRSDDPGFVLGAMLPDLLDLCGSSAPAHLKPQVQAGISHHHEVDGAFHGNPAFLALCGRVSRTLIAEGVPRGGARGAAHVAIELFLDGTLAGDVQALTRYQAALASAPDALRFSEPQDEARWQSLQTRLADGQVPRGYSEPTFVAPRVVRALASRPRLQLDELAIAILQHHLPRIHSWVRETAPALLAAVAFL